MKLGKRAFWLSIAVSDVQSTTCRPVLAGSHCLGFSCVHRGHGRPRSRREGGRAYDRGRGRAAKCGSAETGDGSGDGAARLSGKGVWIAPLCRSSAEGPVLSNRQPGGTARDRASHEPIRRASRTAHPGSCVAGPGAGRRWLGLQRHGAVDDPGRPGGISSAVTAIIASVSSATTPWPSCPA